MTATASPPGAAVVAVGVSRILTSAELPRPTLEADPHAAISGPLHASQVPPDLALVARVARAVAVGRDGDGEAGGA
jgi:hypothetical protein